MPLRINITDVKKAIKGSKGACFVKLENNSEIVKG